MVDRVFLCRRCGRGFLNAGEIARMANIDRFPAGVIIEDGEPVAIGPICGGEIIPTTRSFATSLAEAKGNSNGSRILTY